jgi:NifU-like protein involved in Fe-S cluster formation
MSTYDYFQRAFRRGIQMPTGYSGDKVRDEDGNCAVFWLQAQAGVISSAEYRCTTCATLVAFCEHLAELVIGLRLEKARAYDANRLLALHQDVPKYKAGRAALALEAFRSAVQKVDQGERV